jgi:hypothetical protein
MSRSDLGIDTARVLSLISLQPNRRTSPNAGDVPGKFDYWFDGGACRYSTGVTEYVFLDGTEASTPVLPRYGVFITFADGSELSVNQVLPEDKEAARAEWAARRSVAERPPVPHCIHCGELSPSADGSITRVQCQHCQNFTLAFGKFCEWCGKGL